VSNETIRLSSSRSAPRLPADAVTRTFGFFGNRGAGKTTAARVLVEGISKTDGNAIVFDPVGVWWGATRAGAGPGIPGVVIGGEHGDVPLEETGGHVVAELALARQYKLIVVDLMLLRKGAARRFLADCLEELYHRNRLPLMVVFEEADQTLPQNPRGMDPILGRVLGAAEDIVKLGRSRGLGSTLISQRFATVNKNVTEQTESLFLLRMVGPKDRKAAQEWIESNGDPEVTAKVLGSIASLQQGEGYLYSPGWLRLLERMTIRPSRTLDSSATPTVEQQRVQDEAKRAPVSLESLRDQMAATVQRAEENDPARLRKRIAELERQVSELGNRETPAPEPKPIWPFTDAEFSRAMDDAETALAEAEGARAALASLIQTIERHALPFIMSTEGKLQRLGPLLKSWRERKDVEVESIDRLLAVAAGNAIAPARPSARPATRAARDDRRSLQSPAASRGPSRRQGADSTSVPAAQNGDGPALKAGARRILAEMARVHPLRLTRSQIGLATGLKITGGTFGTYWGTLKRAGLIEENGQDCGVTEEGLDRAGVERGEPMTAEQIQEMWRSRLKLGARNMLDELIDAYPNALTREELGERVGIAITGGTFGTYLGTLRRNGLAVVEAEGISASPDLFVGAGERV
jgi:hypothetical protein